MQGGLTIPCCSALARACIPVFRVLLQVLAAEAIKMGGRARPAVVVGKAKRLQLHAFTGTEAYASFPSRARHHQLRAGGCGWGPPGRSGRGAGPMIRMLS